MLVVMKDCSDCASIKAMAGWKADTMLGVKADDALSGGAVADKAAIEATGPGGPGNKLGRLRLGQAPGLKVA